MRVCLNRGWLLLVGLCAGASVAAADARFDAVDASVDALVAEHRLGGAVLVLAQDGVVVHQRAYRRASGCRRR